MRTNVRSASGLLMRGRYREAEDHLRRSLARQASAPAYNDLAEALRLQGHARAAEEPARKALALDAKLTPAADTLANVLLDLGRSDEAEPFARQACEAGEGRPAYPLTLLRVLLAKGDALAVQEQLDCLRKAKFPAALLSKTER